MPSISIRFWATRDEIASLISDAMTMYSLYAVVGRYPPREYAVVSASEVHSALHAEPPIDRVMLTVTPPQLPISIRPNFDELNPGKLFIDVGRYDGTTLEESWLTCKDVSDNEYSIWKKVGNRLKTLTTAGVTSINRSTGSSGENRLFRYTQGAKELENKGVEMRPSGRIGPIIKLGLALGENAKDGSGK